MAAKAKGRGLIARGMSGHGPKLSRGLQPPAVLKCADNTGARALQTCSSNGVPRKT